MGSDEKKIFRSEDSFSPEKAEELFVERIAEIIFDQLLANPTEQPVEKGVQLPDKK